MNTVGGEGSLDGNDDAFLRARDVLLLVLVLMVGSSNAAVAHHAKKSIRSEFKR